MAEKVYKISFPGLSDKILVYLLANNNRYNGPIAIAEALQEHRETVASAIIEIINFQDFWLKKNSGFGDDPFEVMVSMQQIATIKKWLANGGFTELIKDQDERIQKAHFQETIDLESKLVSIEGTRKAMADADRALETSAEANKISRESIVISHAAQKTAENALIATKWNIAATIIAVVLAWFMGKHC